MANENINTPDTTIDTKEQKQKKEYVAPVCCIWKKKASTPQDTNNEKTQPKKTSKPYVPPVCCIWEKVVFEKQK